MKKRLVLRRNLRLDPPKPYAYRDGYNRLQYTFHHYRIQCVQWQMAGHMGSSNVELDAGYCLDSSVDTEMRSAWIVDLLAFRDFGITAPPVVVQKSPLTRSDPKPHDAAFIGGNRSTNPRPPGYVMGSFGGFRGRADRNRF